MKLHFSDKGSMDNPSENWLKIQIIRLRNKAYNSVMIMVNFIACENPSATRLTFFFLESEWVHTFVVVTLNKII